MAKLLTKRKKPRSYAKYTLTVPVQVYELLREGLELNAVAKTMGIRVGTLTHWIKKHPELQDAVGKALTLRKGDSSDTLRHFIYGRLSPRCQKLWNRIMASEEDTTQLERVKALIYQKPKVMRQQLFFYAFVARNFNLSEACRLIGISKRQLDHWVEEDKAFRDLMEEFHWHKGNFFESALVGLVAQGDSSATIFANKTFNRNRGYGERSNTNTVAPLTTSTRLRRLRWMIWIFPWKSADRFWKLCGTGMPLLKTRVKRSKMQILK